MDQSEEMAKLRAIVEGTVAEQKKKKLDEMFFYPDDRTERQKARAAQGHDELARRQERLGKDWLSKPNDYKTKDDPRYQDMYKIKGPKGVLPEDDGAGDELQTLMKKYGVMEDSSCNMTAEGEECPVHGIDECGMYEAGSGRKPDYLDFDKDGDTDEDMVDAIEDMVDETVHIEVDGAEAAMLINRMAELAGSQAHVDSGMSADMCQGCGCETDRCTCDADCCDDCGEYDCQCSDDEMHPAVPMENADFDHGHHEVSAEGEPIDVDTVTWRGRSAPGTQGYVKGGDNPLIKEDANKLFAKLKGDYKAYVAEAELARSNTGNESPLTANNRDEFDKDPFDDKTPVTDGSHSPLSTVERQKLKK